MDKKLVNDLKTIIEAKKKRDNQINKNQIYDVEHFMDKSIIREYQEIVIPSEPIEPKKPQMPVKPTEPSKPIEENLPNKLNVDKSFTEFCSKCLIFGIIAIIIGLIVVACGNTEYERGYELYINGRHDWNLTPAEEVMDGGMTTMIIGWVILAIGVGFSALPYPIKMNKSYKKAKIELNELKEKITNKNIKKLEQYNAELKQYYIKLEIYEKETKKYPEYLKLYDQEMINYNKKLADYNKETQNIERIKKAYEKEKEKAYILMQKHNDQVSEKAEKELDQLLESLQTYFPKKYLYDIDTLLGYIIDARADTLKEAIALLIEDEHRNTLEYEARKAADDVETTLKIQKGMQQCSHCRNRYNCYKSADNDGSCWNFERY